MTKKRGRPQTHWAENARLWAWYWMIRDSGISDYELDLEFAWAKKSGETCDPSERPQVFENIRKLGFKPAGGENRKSITEIVLAIEGNERFTGSRAIYEAELWDLFQNESPIAEHWTEQFENYLTRNSLIQISPFEGHLSGLSLKVGTIKFFERCLALSLRDMDLIDRVTLLWMLFQQTQAARTWEIRSLLESKLDQDLERFFHIYLAKQDPQEFYFLATRAMFNIRLVSKRPSYLQYVGKRSEWFILPCGKLNSLTEDDFQGGFRSWSGWADPIG
jgi:hypothetical protein